MDNYNDQVIIMSVFQPRGHHVITWLRRAQNDQTWLDWGKKCESIWYVSIYPCAPKLW